MHPNTQLITRFYTAFQRRDPAGMAECYHPEVHFSDPVFPDLHGRQAALMWEMLCRRGKDLRIEFRNIQADDRAGSAEWEAWYTFSATGRAVQNRIRAEFGFRDGAIVRHVDRFPFWRWARQALGPMGWLLGWSALVRNRVRKNAQAALAAFEGRSLENAESEVHVTAPVPDRPERFGLEDKVFLLLVVAVSLAFAWIMSPFFGAILWAVILAILFAPLEQRMLRLFRGRHTLAALATALGILVLVILPLTALVSLLVREVLGLYQSLQSGELHFGRFLQRALDALPTWVGALLDRVGLGSLGALEDRLQESMTRIVEFIAKRALSIGQNTLQFVVSLFIMLYLLFFLLRDGEKLLAEMRAAIPLRPEQQTPLFAQFAGVVQATVKGSVVVAVVQGVLGSLMLWFLGVRAPVLWGAVMAVLSLLPAVGPPAVWAPIAIYFLLTGSTWQGIVLALYGALVVGSVDNILRPILVGKATRMPDWVVLISTLGGIALIGLNGFVVGPAIAAMFIAVWRIFGATRAAAQAAT